MLIVEQTRVRDVGWHAIEVRGNASMLSKQCQVEHARRVGLACSEASLVDAQLCSIVACRSPLSARGFAQVFLSHSRLLVSDVERAPAHVSSTALVQLSNQSVIRYNESSSSSQSTSTNSLANQISLCDCCKIIQ